MKRLFLPWLAAFALAGCAKTATEPSLALVGTWKLVSRQCECAPAPTPDETVTFTATGFAFYRNGQFVATGTYATTTAHLCGSPAASPVLRFTYTTVRLPSANAAAAVRANMLVLDYGGECDAPVDIYQRLL